MQPRPMSVDPAVSVVIPAYNATQYITEALDSVLAQTFTDYEVIVVNDGSPDTSDLERALLPYRESVLYIRQDNRGPSGARNAAIRVARGEYLAFLDADDAWQPNYLAEQMKVLRQDSTLDVVYADAIICGNPFAEGRTFMQNSPSRGPVTFVSLLRWECHLITSCVLARRRTVMAAGMFDERFRHAEDFDLWLRVAHGGGRITYQERVLARRRETPGSLSMQMTRMNRSLVEILKKAACTLELSDDERQLLARQIAECEAFADLEDGKERLGSGHYGEAVQALQRANSYYRKGTLGAVLLGLRVAPWLVGAVYKCRRWLLTYWVLRGRSLRAR